ncbi:hypothetical protein SLUN_12225 [Streptomyces lunaelactis]|uniref:Uncharacterized protein n=1 Tax=Streptomyces lunaelactis TaxID=1535768 RepID=A0A2R4T153_9ACTN|nr:hypothetical protein [Streptomyces lunaelactis]AVZ72842.1 hypothetical protein SLUN_12225 [Streptomyces lunaelactis]NUK06417.1 hypothetical protein [Streptomyces lunaelactis]NUK13678.1 hypothetical protein [Streptomyces lunaelactis]NUK28503.1 hypothetical protein [Streptomyces lunaelactis]NUK39286.1 hypothetical protein [Streptomyces lunaelactis]
METFVTVLVMLGMIALGAIALQMLNNQHDENIAAFPTGGRTKPRIRHTAREWFRLHRHSGK